MKKIDHYIAGWHAAEQMHFGEVRTPQAAVEKVFVTAKFARESAAIALELERLQRARDLEYERIDAIHRER